KRQVLQESIQLNESSQSSPISAEPFFKRPAAFFLLSQVTFPLLYNKVLYLYLCSHRIDFTFKNILIF
ncbi:hypothetical protein, partial [Streptococcus oralis]|uniref:hypothetical protein n=1 Tax=Streptococcus oralis TaxID=1303 RepID=UPI0019D38E12